MKIFKALLALAIILLLAVASLFATIITVVALPFVYTFEGTLDKILDEPDL